METMPRPKNNKKQAKKILASAIKEHNFIINQLRKIESQFRELSVSEQSFEERFEELPILSIYDLNYVEKNGHGPIQILTSLHERTLLQNEYSKIESGLISNISKLNNAKIDYLLESVKEVEKKFKKD